MKQYYMLGNNPDWQVITGSSLLNDLPLIMIRHSSGGGNPILSKSNLLPGRVIIR
jgi:hypothetical protein